MIFVKLGKLIAWALFVLGALKCATGIFVATMFDTHESMVAASKRYLGSTNSGEAIDQGIWMIVAGVVLGLLVKIADRK